MRIAGFHVLFGRSGGGKSTAAAQTWDDSLYFATGPTLLQFYKQWLLKPENKDFKLPKVEIVHDQYSGEWRARDGKIMRSLPPQLDAKTRRPLYLPQKSEFESSLYMLIDRASTEKQKGNPPPYNAFIIDEAGELWTRVLRELKAASPGDTRKAFGDLNDWTDNMIGMFRLLVSQGVSVVLVGHEQEPEGNDKLGGPKFPSRNLGPKICAAADSVIFRYVEDVAATVKANALLDDAPAAETEDPLSKMPMKRLWRVHASQHWLCKIRGIPDEDFELIATMTLAEIMTRAGY